MSDYTDLEYAERHAEAAESLLRDAVIRADAAEARCADLQARCERLEKVLEFYADPETWCPPRTGWSEAGNDKGYKARAALQHTTAETGDE